MRKNHIKLLSMSLGLITATAFSPLSASALNPNVDSRQPRYSPANNFSNLSPDSTMHPKNVPDFARQKSSLKSSGTALKADLASTTIPVETRMKLVLETAVDARTSTVGDIFEAHVKDDIYLGMTLLLPRGSLVRGRVAQVQKPRLLSRAGKIGLKLDQMVTPQGEVIPLEATLEFKKGVTNKKGQLDPGTNFGTRVESSVRSVSGINKDGEANGALLAANIATLGAPVVATALGSSAIALFSRGDTVSLAPGQELEILLTNDMGLQIN